MNAATFVVDHDEDVRVEPPRLGGEREDHVEARAIAGEEHDAAQPGPLRQCDERVRNPRSVEAGGQELAGAALHPESDRPARLATITPSSTGSTGFATCMLKPAESERTRSSGRP